MILTKWPFWHEFSHFAEKWPFWPLFCQNCRKVPFCAKCPGHFLAVISPKKERIMYKEWPQMTLFRGHFWCHFRCKMTPFLVKKTTPIFCWNRHLWSNMTIFVTKNGIFDHFLEIYLHIQEGELYTFMLEWSLRGTEIVQHSRHAPATFRAPDGADCTHILRDSRCST